MSDPGFAAATDARSSLRRLLSPRSVALVGASPKPFSLGGNVLANIESFGFPGGLHLVSRSHSEIGGHPCVPSIDDLPEGIDALVLVVPASAVRSAVESAGARGIGGAVVFASGFGELGAEGRTEEEAVALAARKAGLALLGPNCLGLTNFVARAPLTFEPLPPTSFERPGAGIISQSGAMAGNIRLALLSRGLPVSYVVSTGNEAVTGSEDVLAELVEDDDVAFFSLFVEQIRRPQKFLALAGRARALGKPIVLLHPGRSRRSREAAVTHTGALAGDHAVMSCYARSEGILLVETLDELFDVTALVASGRTPGEGCFAMMTNSGAVRGLALDMAEDLNLELAELTPATRTRLASDLPDFATTDNPLDITAQGMQDPGLFGASAAALLDDETTGAMLCAAMAGGPAQAMAKWRSLRPVLEASRKPVALAFLGDGAPLSSDVLEDIAESGLPFFRSADRAMRAFARLAESTKPRPDQSYEPPAPESAIGEGTLAEYAAKTLLGRYGLAFPKGALATSLDHARRIAVDIGYPVVLKAQSRDLAHKTDAGGVVLGIDDETRLAAAYEAISERVARAHRRLVLDGILVEAMAASGGVELIAGARRDPDWGPVLLVGFGGVMAEIVGDTQLIRADASPAVIRQAIQSLKGAALLAGHRGAPPADLNAAVDVLTTLGALMLASPGLEAVEVNPLRLYPNGALGLDALMVFRNDGMS